MSKKVAAQSIIGQTGANFVERIVLKMKYAWRPILIFDVGVDGEIEICDPVTGEATNAIVRVQVKTTTKPFQAETNESLEYSCDQRDLDYWLRGNAPVILIVCRPDTDEAYWVSVKDYFKDMILLKSRKVHFSKSRDHFDATCASALKQLALPKDSGIYFAPLPKAENLYSNLLKVLSFAPKIYVADTNYRTPGELWATFKTMGAKVGSEWTLTSRQILSFYDLHEEPFKTVCDIGTCESFNTRVWADTHDEDKKRDFVRLLNMCLRERTYLLGLRFLANKERKYHYFAAAKGLRTRKVWYRSIKRRASREVFKQYGKKSDPLERAYCRHSAFKGYFLRISNEWYLEITPTYHFTSNGYDEDMFRAQRLQGIKRLERNPAVIGHLLMWADYLRRSTRSLFSSEYPFLAFGNLATAEIRTGLPDDIWYQAEEDNEQQSMSAKDNQLGLLGL